MKEKDYPKIQHGLSLMEKIQKYVIINNG